jgi:hypothetical protein
MPAGGREPTGAHRREQRIPYRRIWIPTTLDLDSKFIKMDA